MTHLRIAAALAALLAWAGAAFAADDIQAMKARYTRPATIPFPKDNPYTPEKAALGKMLFFDARLSRDRNLSCASCHNPSFGWEVPFAKAIGAGGKPLGRHAPTTINLAWTPALFWDGRAASLEAQARGPIESPEEMDLPLPAVVERLKAVQGYRQAFARAFKTEGLTEATVLKAIATYERTLLTELTPFDRWVRGEAGALAEPAQRGFVLFNTKARCAACHSGWNFTDGRFHDIGLADTDAGRAAASGRAEDRGGMKTPGLREIASRAPYMHDGSLPTLEAVVMHYVGGGVDRASRSSLMRPVALNAQEVADLVAFMQALSSPQRVVAMPNLPAN